MAINFQQAEFIRSATAPKDFPRDGLPQVAFAGRSNVGKSSVINRLLGRKNFARVGAAPGKTVHINYFLIDKTFYLVDLPGYGYAKVSKAERDRWGRLMEDYFADRELMTFDSGAPELPEAVAEQVEISVKYEGYIRRQEKQVEELRQLEKHRLPPDMEYSHIQGLRLEAREKLAAVRPLDLGQASRISGVSPADIAALMIWLHTRTEGGNTT